MLHVASGAGAVGFALATSEHASRLDSIVLVAPLPSGGLADVGFEAADSVVEAMVSRRAQPADGAREVARSHYEGALFSMAQFDKTAELGERTVAVLFAVTVAVVAVAAAPTHGPHARGVCRQCCVSCASRCRRCRRIPARELARLRPAAACHAACVLSGVQLVRASTPRYPLPS